MPKKLFDPFNAISMGTDPDDADKDYMHVDDEYLASNIHWKPPVPDEIADWQPMEIPDYDSLRILHVDIETTGLNPTNNRIVMIGIMCNENDAFKGTIYGEELEQLKQGKIFQAKKPNHDVAEALIIANFILRLEKLKPQVLDLHNGFEFDTKFIQRRIEILRKSKRVQKAIKKYPKLAVLDDDLFYISQYEKTITAASMYGRPIVFTPVYTVSANHAGYHNLKNTDIQIIDTMHLAAQVDKIKANMSSYTLKYLAHYVKFRTEKRLELKHTEIQEYWQSQDPEKLEKLRQYLIFDLEDQRAVGNFFLPSVWYQKMFVNMPLQELAVASPAKKWNSILTDYYHGLNQKSKFDANADWYEIPEDDEKVKYKGAFVECNPGLYKNFFKIDVSSMYPSIIEEYELIDIKKDPLRVSLVVLRFAKKFRYVFKAAAGDNPHEILDMPAFKYVKSIFKNVELDNITEADKIKFKSIDGTQKVVINGFYGFLGVGGYAYNSMGGAALTTGYGRVLMKDIMYPECERWARIVNVDTDGLCLQPKLSDDVDWTGIDGYEVCPKTGEQIPFVAQNSEEEYVNPKFIWARVQKLLPEGITIDTEDNCPEGAIYAPKMKNYLWWKDRNSDPKTKGIYRKRNRSRLQKDFPINYLYNLAFQDDDCAEEYYDGIINLIGGFDTNNAKSDELELFTFTQNIPSNNKILVSFNVGKPRDKVSFVWCSLQEYTPKKGIPKKNLTKLPVCVTITETNEYQFTPQKLPDTIKDDDVNLALNTSFYKGDIDKLKNEIDRVVGLK
ncbi:DNA polymerase elongation subunit (family B) [Leptolyngbya sp. PCC 7375]|nr:DNA polymerase elongation subunit (family B) [Leptolyngbya sp. PCC 7375]